MKCTDKKRKTECWLEHSVFLFCRMNCLLDNFCTFNPLSPKIQPCFCWFAHAEVFNKFNPLKKAAKLATPHGTRLHISINTNPLLWRSGFVFIPFFYGTIVPLKSRKSIISNIFHSNSKTDSPLIIVPLFLPSQISFIEPGLSKLNTCIGRL